MEMMTKSNLDFAEVVKKAFQDKGLHFDAQDVDDEVLFSIGMPLRNAPGIKLNLRVSKSGDAKIWCYLARRIAPAKRNSILDVLNQLNSKYRYVCVSLDSDGDIPASYDFTLYGEEEAAGEHAIAMLILMTKIVDHCIPDVMTELWRKDSSDKTLEEINLALFDEQSGGDATSQIDEDVDSTDD